MPQRTPVLILFSGGKDSFIAACREIQDGKKARLISFNNSAVIGEKNLLHGTARLENRYGPDAVSYEGCYNTGAVIQTLTDAWADSDWNTLGRAYGPLTNGQAVCLHRQTAMWVAAIAYADAHSIPEIACGYRKSDVFCTGQADYIDRIRSLAMEHGLVLSLPVWDDSAWTGSPGGIGRDYEMARHGFRPAVYEPKCMLGRPVRPMTEAQRKTMASYFDNILLGPAREEINLLVPIFRAIRLSPESMTVFNYPVPDGRDGYY